MSRYLASSCPRKPTTMSCPVPHCPCKGDPKWKLQTPSLTCCFFQYHLQHPRPHTLLETGNVLSLGIWTVTTAEKQALEKLLIALEYLEVDKEDLPVK